MTVTPYDVVALDPGHYECSEGHGILNARDEMRACPVCVHGQRCPGILVAFGPGSRKRAAA